MTGTQILVLVLLVAAFAVGWVAARTAGDRDSLPDGLRELLEDVDDALDRAWRSYRALTNVASRARPDAAEVTLAALNIAETNLRDLRSKRAAMKDRLGASHPLVEDLDQALSALELLSADDTDRSGAESPDAAVAGALDRTANEGRIRVQRGIRSLEDATRAKKGRKLRRIGWN